MKNPLHTKIVPAALLMLALAAAAPAAGLPDYYPQSFRMWGKIDRIDAAGGVLIINDSVFRVPAELRVYTPDTRFGTVQSLRAGMKVGFAVPGAARDGGALLPELWVLPDDYAPPRR